MIVVILVLATVLALAGLPPAEIVWLLGAAGGVAAAVAPGGRLLPVSRNC